MSSGDLCALPCPWEHFLNADARASSIYSCAASMLVWSSGSAAEVGSGSTTLIACLHHHEFKYFSRPSNAHFFARQYYPSGRLADFRDVGAKAPEMTKLG